MRKDNKEDVEVKPEEKIIDWETRLVKQVKDEWDKGTEYVDDLNRLYEKLYKMIRGERPEKNYDWQSNVVINKVFQVCWTTITYMSQKIFGASPIIGVRGKNRGDRGADDRQEILEFWHTFQCSTGAKHTPFFLVVVMWILRACLNGVGIMKKTWHQRFQTIGGKRVAVEDWPYNVVVNNRDIRCDWALQPGQSIRQGRFVVHREITDLDALFSSKINYINLDELEVKLSAVDTEGRQDATIVRQMDDQSTPPDSDIYSEVEIYERVGEYPVYKEKKDGKWIPCFEKEAFYKEKPEAVFKHMIITTVPDQNLLIRFEPNPYNEINYIDFHLYLDAERWQSMGQAESISDLQTAISDNINAAFDEIWQNLMPPTVVNKYALWDWDTMQYAPGQRWLVGGNPQDAIKWKESSNITSDSWMKHQLLDNEIQLTSSVTPPMQGMGKEKAATTNIMNAQMSANKMDFLVKMMEITGLVPSAQMDVRFAKKFADPFTFHRILGRPFAYSEYPEEMYKFIPAASSVKLDYQKEVEIQQDMQLMQIIANIPNPNSAKVLNMLIANILRNRDWKEEAALFDENYFEPKSEAGQVEMMNRSIEGGSASNQNMLPMTQPERSVRQQSFNMPTRVQ